jgi:hypothetical protein
MRHPCDRDRGAGTSVPCPRIARRPSNGISNVTSKGPVADWLDATPGEANMIAIIAIGWLLAIWAAVLAFSVYFSQNMK